MATPAVSLPAERTIVELPFIEKLTTMG